MVKNDINVKWNKADKNVVITLKDGTKQTFDELEFMSLAGRVTAVMEEILNNERKSYDKPDIPF